MSEKQQPHGMRSRANDRDQAAKAGQGRSAIDVRHDDDGAWCAARAREQGRLRKETLPGWKPTPQEIRR